MPILPDGSLQIVNQQTGEKKVVKPEELGNYGIPYAVYDKAKKEYDTQQATLSNLQSGVGDLSKVASDNPQMVQQAIQSGKIKVPPSKEEQAGIDSINQITSLLDQYRGIPAGEKGPGKYIINHAPILGQYLAPHAQEYDRSRDAMSGLLRDIAGGSGVRITETQLKKFQELLPSEYKTDTQNTIDVDQLNKQLRSKYGKGLPQDMLDSFGVGKEKSSGKSGSSMQIGKYKVTIQ